MISLEREYNLTRYNGAKLLMRLEYTESNNKK